ncbi:hypothetical protein CDD80_2412 [Ophiocordyceps camponoti-rufipedis]|uniref:Uncharacterized protein n=1 Tax=Ophiocordyceps camponoti-rufipedis TaxID=2004952 RepID=A0A2C5XTG6_9HYPO|nr:hypothetical protein CDD80_2412 [Ophiocordyceps camponoti-rufipedis]
MMTDAELDRDWKPNGRRPQSTVARSFSDELMDIFRIDNSLTDLDQKVDQRRQNVGKNNQELADIEARIREMEDRLRRSQQQNRASLQSLPVSTPQKRADAQPQAPAPRDPAVCHRHPAPARVSASIPFLSPS